MKNNNNKLSKNEYKHNPTLSNEDFLLGHKYYYLSENEANLDKKAHYLNLSLKYNNFNALERAITVCLEKSDFDQAFYFADISIRHYASLGLLHKIAIYAVLIEAYLYEKNIELAKAYLIQYIIHLELSFKIKNFSCSIISLNNEAHQLNLSVYEKHMQQINSWKSSIKLNNDDFKQIEMEIERQYEKLLLYFEA